VSLVSKGTALDKASVYRSITPIKQNQNLIEATNTSLKKLAQ
jgi:hypothetical protein